MAVELTGCSCMVFELFVFIVQNARLLEKGQRPINKR